jgi:hypothetical protein
MFKFLRKYSVWIMGFGGSLLLIAFLAPNVIQQLAQQAGYAGASQAEVGDGETVGFDEWQQILRESQIIDRLGTSIPGIGFVESPAHWFLLTREANLAGLTPPIRVVGIDTQSLLAIASNTGSRPEFVLQTLAHLQGVQRLIQTYQTAGRFSDRRLRKVADDLLSSVAVETIVIPSTPEDNESFSDEKMQAQLDLWADTPVGEGDHGFGYKMPNRFKVEWLHIPVDAINQATRNSDGFSTMEQRKFWRRNENDPRFPFVESGASVPEVVRDAFLDTLTKKTSSDISRFASDQLRNPRRGVEERNGFIVLPDGWLDKQVGLEQLAASLQEEFDIVLPAYGSVAQLTTTEDATSIPVIGSIVAMNLGDLPTSFTTLVQAAKEFDGNGLFRIQEGVASPVIETADGDLCIFRITETDPARKPNSIDEVRAAVANDLGRIARWETLQAEADIIVALARDAGMLATSVKYGVTVNRPKQVSMVDTGVPSILDASSRRPLMIQSISQRMAAGQQISDMFSTIPNLETNDEAVIQAIIDKAADLPIETHVASLDKEDRIFVVPSYKNMALVLVRVTGTAPASSELAAAFSGGTSTILQTMVSVDELGGTEGIGDVFSFESLAKRHKFKRGRRCTDEDDDDSTATN